MKDFTLLIYFIKIKVQAIEAFRKGGVKQFQGNIATENNNLAVKGLISDHFTEHEWTQFRNTIFKIHMDENIPLRHTHIPEEIMTAGIWLTSS